MNERLKELEQERDKAIARISQEYVAAIERLEIDYDSSPKTSFEVYRKAKDEARQRCNAGIKQAQDNLDKDNKEAEDIYNSSPTKAKQHYMHGKQQARVDFNQTRLAIEQSFKQQAEEMVKQQFGG